MMIKRLLGAATLLAVLGCGTIGWLLLSPLPMQQSGLLRISHGDSFDSLLNQMAKHQRLGPTNVEKGRRFAAHLYSRVYQLGRHLHVGEYKMIPGDSLLDVLQRLNKGDVYQRAFTLIDGWNFRQVRKALAKAPSLIHVLPELSNSEVAKKLGLKQTKVEGWLAPNTYFYTYGASDMDILRRAVSRQQGILKRLWKGRDDKLPYNTPYKALIMASIVEKESAIPDEMDKVAGVFVSRLRIGMRLQTDPTVIYALGKTYHGDITYEDLRVKSPYNTYRHGGLPPGPIAMPSVAAIEAVMHPQVTDNLYFVGKGDGTHAFSKTLIEHNRAVRKYQLHPDDSYHSAPEPSQ